MRIRKVHAPAIILFAFFLFLYVTTAAPSVTYSDSGEFITAIHTLGIAHPSGYPLYIMIGKLFTLLPIGTVAFRVNVMSAFFGGLSAAMLYLVGLRFTRKPFAAAIAALLFCLSHVYWSQAIIADVHTLHIFLVLCSTHFLLNWNEQRKPISLWLCFFFLGLSFTMHLMTVVLIPGFAYLLLAGNRKDLFNKKTIAFSIIFFLIGLSPYAYLPLRSVQGPLLDWGSPRTLPAFVAHVTGSQYRGYMMTVPLATLLSRITGFLSSLVLVEFYPFYAWLAVPGVVWLYKKSRQLCIFLFLIFAADAALAINYGIPEVQYYYIPAYLVFALFIGCGITSLLDVIQPFLAKASHPRLLSIALFMLMLLFPAYALYAGMTVNDKSNYTHPRDCGMAALKRFPRDSIVITQFGGEYFVLMYLKYVEAWRPDIRLVHYSSLAMPWYQELIRKEGVLFNAGRGSNREIFSSIVAENINRAPLFINAEEDTMQAKAELALTRCSSYQQIMNATI